MLKSIVSIDLVGYGDLARTLEEALGPNAVGKLHQQVGEIIKRAIYRNNKSNEFIKIADGGDGMILAFDNPIEAVQFSEMIHHVAKEFSAGKSTSLGVREFRVGVSTGMISEGSDGQLDGYAIVIAVRLQTSAAPDMTLIDASTYKNLPAEFRRCFSAPIFVLGKRNEKFEAHKQISGFHAVFSSAENEKLEWQKKKFSLFEIGSGILLASSSGVLITGLLMMEDRPDPLLVSQNDGESGLTSHESDEKSTFGECDDVDDDDEFLEIF